MRTVCVSKVPNICCILVSLLLYSCLQRQDCSQLCRRMKTSWCYESRLCRRHKEASRLATRVQHSLRRIPSRPGRQHCNPPALDSRHRPRAEHPPPDRTDPVAPRLVLGQPVLQQRCEGKPAERRGRHVGSGSGPDSARRSRLSGAGGLDLTSELLAREGAAARHPRWRRALCPRALSAGTHLLTCGCSHALMGLLP